MSDFPKVRGHAVFARIEPTPEGPEDAPADDVILDALIAFRKHVMERGFSGTELDHTGRYTVVRYRTDLGEGETDRIRYLVVETWLEDMAGVPATYQIYTLNGLVHRAALHLLAGEEDRVATDLAAGDPYSRIC